MFLRFFFSCTNFTTSRKASHICWICKNLNTLVCTYNWPITSIQYSCNGTISLFLFLLSFQFIYHKKTYGTSIKATKSLILSSVMENPEFQKQLQQQKEERVKKVKQFQQNKSPVSKSNSFPFKATGIFLMWFILKKIILFICTP